MNLQVLGKSEQFTPKTGGWKGVVKSQERNSVKRRVGSLEKQMTICCPNEPKEREDTKINKITNKRGTLPQVSMKSRECLGKTYIF